MLDDSEDKENNIVSNIHRIKRIKSGRPITAKNNRLNANKDFVNNLKKGNLDIQAFSIENQNKFNELSNKSRASNRGPHDFDFDNKSDLEKLISEENPYIEHQLQQTSKLKNINLIEENYEDLYGWKSLFCKSRPISLYTQVKNNKKNLQKNKTSEEEKNISITNTQNSQIQYQSQSESLTLNDKENNISEFEEKVVKEKIEIKSKTKKIRHPFRDNIPELNNDFQKSTNSFNYLNSKKDKEKDDGFIFPVALIDEQPEKLFEYITIPKNVSDRRKKMDNFLLLASKALKKSQNHRKNNHNSSVKRIKNRSNSMTNSIIDLASKKNASLQATSTPLKSKSRNFNNNNNISVISQSLILSKNDKNSAIRPMSVYAKRSDKAVYYMSKEFSDYFKQDLKEFCDKFSLLHPKIRCDNKKIKKILEEIKKNQDEDEKLMKNFKLDDDEFNIKDLLLAGNSKNIVPLLKNFIRKYYADQEVSKIFNDRIYPISSRPLTSKPKLRENKVNIRGKIMSDLKDSIEKNDNKMKLEIDTYDKNDPDLKIFENDLEEPDDDFEYFDNNFNEKESIQQVQNVIIEDPIEKENISNSNNDILDITKDKESFMKSNNFSDENNIKPNFSRSIKSGNEEEVKKENTPIVNVNVNNEVEFKEKKITKRPQTAFNKKYINSRINVDRPEKFAELEEKSEVFLEKKINRAKNLNLKLNINERNISPIKVMSYKGIIHPHSYKMMNFNKKNQSNVQENNITAGVFSNAFTVQNFNKQVLANTQEINPAKNSAPIVFENIDMKQRKRPTTSRWSSNVSNLSNKLNNQYNSNIINEKTKNFKANTNKNKLNNVYFNKYIDMQFKSTNVFQKSSTNKITPNLNPNYSNRDESYNFSINPTVNEKFVAVEKKNVSFIYFYKFF